MARTFAGFFGSLAMLTILARGVLEGGSADSTLLAAWCSLLLFSVLGYLIGWVAAATVEQSVGSMVAAELSKQESKEKTQVGGEATWPAAQLLVGHPKPINLCRPPGRRGCRQEDIERILRTGARTHHHGGIHGNPCRS